MGLAAGGSWPSGLTVILSLVTKGLCHGDEGVGMLLPSLMEEGGMEIEHPKHRS